MFIFKELVAKEESILYARKIALNMLLRILSRSGRVGDAQTCSEICQSRLTLPVSSKNAENKKKCSDPALAIDGIPTETPGYNLWGEIVSTINFLSFFQTGSGPGTSPNGLFFNFLPSLSILCHPIISLIFVRWFPSIKYFIPLDRLLWKTGKKKAKKTCESSGCVGWRSRPVSDIQGHDVMSASIIAQPFTFPPSFFAMFSCRGLPSFALHPFIGRGALSSFESGLLSSVQV